MNKVEDILNEFREDAVDEYRRSKNNDEYYDNLNVLIDECKRKLKSKVVPSIEETRKIVDLYNSSTDCPIDGSKVTWNEYREHFAKAFINLCISKFEDTKSV